MLSGGQTIALTLGAAGLSAAAALIGVFLSGFLQADREKRTYLRQFDERRMKDLRDDYGVLMIAVEAWQHVIHQRRFLLAGETKDERDKRLTEDLSRATTPLKASLVRLHFESDAQSITELFNKCYDEYIKYSVAWSQEASSEMAQMNPQLAIDRATEVTRAATRLNELASLLKREVQDKIASLLGNIRS